MYIVHLGIFCYYCTVLMKRKKILGTVPQTDYLIILYRTGCYRTHQCRIDKEKYETEIRAKVLRLPNIKFSEGWDGAFFQGSLFSETVLRFSPFSTVLFKYVCENIALLACHSFLVNSLLFRILITNTWEYKLKIVQTTEENGDYILCCECPQEDSYVFFFCIRNFVLFYEWTK